MFNRDLGTPWELYFLDPLDHTHKGVRVTDKVQSA